MTHCRLAIEMCRACWADGSATITTDASSTIMSWATAMTARDQYRLGSGASVCGAVVGTISVVVTGNLRARGGRKSGSRSEVSRLWPSHTEWVYNRSGYSVSGGTIRNVR